MAAPTIAWMVFADFALSLASNSNSDGFESSLPMHGGIFVQAMNKLVGFGYEKRGTSLAFVPLRNLFTSLLEIKKLKRVPPQSAFLFSD